MHDDAYSKLQTTTPMETEIQLAIMVPRSVKKAVQQRARADGITVRALLLRLIRDAGIASVADAELLDRRNVAALARVRQEAHSIPHGCEDETKI